LPLIEELLQIEPNRLVLHLDHALCLIALDRLEEARAVLEASRALLEACFPRDVLLARIAAKQGDTAFAVEHRARACRLDAAAIPLAAQAPELLALMRSVSQLVALTPAARCN
jgi:predicted Zn-dependent protease